MKIKHLFLIAFCALLAANCTHKTTTTSKKDETAMNAKPLPAPEWAKNTNIYEVNIRQYTKEGSFKAFEKELPRLHKMGVDVLWFMPIQPIGVKKRKGTLGSYYSISDYKAVNPEFGTLADFKSVVAKAHSLGMKVMLDWVANHTSWDHVWIEKHPDWFTQKNGQIIAPVPEWEDVADLNYNSKEMRHAMVDALQYWVKECDIDGYRCDMAMMVPLNFWEDDVRPYLDKTKNLLWLAEAEGPEFHKKAFHITYGWDWHHLFNDMAQGKKKIADLDALMAAEKAKYPANSWRLQFTSNHDENSWNGSEQERMGGAYRTFAVLAATLPGVPLMYSGQETGLLNRKLKFFDKDEIPWGVCVLNDFYKKLWALKKNNSAMTNAAAEGNFTRLKTNHDDVVYAFSRQKGKDKVVVIANISASRLDVTLSDDLSGDYQDALTGYIRFLKPNSQITLKAYETAVLEKKAMNHQE